MNVSELLAIPVIQLLDGTYPAKSIKVIDTATNLVNNASAIFTLGEFVSTISVPDGLDVTQALSLPTLLPLLNSNIVDTASNIIEHASELKILGGNLSFQISDTAANLVSNAPAILMLGALISSISVTDGLNVAQGLSLSSLLSLIDSSYGPNITDTAANVIAHATELKALHQSVWIADTAANLASNAPTILKLGALASNIYVTDGLDVAKALSMKTLLPYLSSQFGSILDKAANIIAHASELKALHQSVGIYDTAANLASNVPAIIKLGALVSTIYVTDGLNEAQELYVVGLNVAQVLSIVDLMPLISDKIIVDTASNIIEHASELYILDGYLSFQIADTAANLVSNASAILDLRILDSTIESNITVTDGLNVTQALSLSTLLPLIAQSWQPITDTVANVIAHASELIASSGGIHFNIIDRVANVIAHANEIIVFGSSISVQIYDTVANLVTNSSALASAGLNVNFLISDSFTNLQSHSAQLFGTPNYGGQITKIIFTDILGASEPLIISANYTDNGLMPIFDFSRSIGLQGPLKLTESVLNVVPEGSVSGIILTLSDDNNHQVVVNVLSNKPNLDPEKRYLNNILTSDDISPKVISFSPNDGATEVTIASNITLTFSEPIQKGIGTIAIHVGSAAGIITASFDVASSNHLVFSGNSLIIDPITDLAKNTHYFITFDKGSIKDLVGNSFSDSSVYDFKTKMNTISGKTGNDKLVGTNASDSINGGKGADSMKGGLGSDIYFVDNKGDVVIENKGAGTDTVNSSISFILGPNVENLTLTGKAAINGTGNALNNILIGNSAANKLSCLAGNDILNGGLGKDILTGGNGKDIFKLTTLSKDTITDFSVKDDTLQLENSVFSKLIKTGVLSTANFKVGAATDNNDYVLYNSNTGVVSYDANGNAAGGATQIAVIGAHLALTHLDFFVI